MNVLVFDIETIPDVEFARTLNDFDGLTDAEVIKALDLQRMDEAGTTFQKHFMHQVVAISCVYASDADGSFHVWSLGKESDDEATLIETFYKGLAQKKPTLVSWNGSGFDLPVLNYRAMKHKISASEFWRTEGDYKWNNYVSRYHERHTDVMDILAMYGGRANAPLDKIASLLGYPGKMGMDGSKVSKTYLDGDIKAIRDYCETDVLNTYLVYLRYELLRGNLTQHDLEQKENQLIDWLAAQSQEHFFEFLSLWQDS